MLTLDGQTTVRKLFTAHPDAFAVLQRHGMYADCKAHPPPVPLVNFAGKHGGGDLAGLVEEIRTATGLSETHR